MHYRSVIPFVAAAATASLSCRESPRATQKPAAQQPTQQVFAVKGVIKAVEPARKLVTIEHEKIPDYMAAMTMDFEVKNTNELTGLSAGDYVSFRMIVQPKDAWIDQITRLTNSKPVANAPDTFRR